MRGTPRVVQLDESHIDAATHVLARALHSDPIHIHACPDPVQRARWLPFSLAPYVWKSFLNGVVLGTEGPLVGVAAVVGPDFEQISFSDHLASYDERARAELGNAAWENYSAAFSSVFDIAEAELERAIPEPHWYLDMLGVDPATQGVGIGGEILSALNTRADAGAHPVGLLTFQPDNLPFYARWGYKTIAEGTDDQSGLHWWIFQRPSKSFDTSSGQR